MAFVRETMFFYKMITVGIIRCVWCSQY